MIPGFATSEGTGRYVSRFSGAQAAGFFRLAQALNVSSLGIGTYLGNADDRTDQAYSEAVLAALRGGINFIDTAINYRHQRSERAIGIALRQAINAGDVQRDEVVVCTKAGFLTPGAVPPSLPQEEVAGGMHSMAPDFLGDQIDRSRSNLGLDTLDVFYLHNTETRLGLVSRDRFETRVTRVFERLEHLVTEGAIRYYGIATWDGFRKPGALDLGRMAELARSA